MHRLVSPLIHCHEHLTSTIKTPTGTLPVILSANQPLFYYVHHDAVSIHAVSILPVESHSLFAVSFRTSLILDQPISIIFLRMLHPNINEGWRGKICQLRFAKFTQQNTPGKICLAKHAWQNMPGKSCHVPPLFCTKRRFSFSIDGLEGCFIIVAITSILNHCQTRSKRNENKPNTLH